MILISSNLPRNIAERWCMIILTPWLPGYKYIVPGNWAKTKHFRLSYQPHSSSGDCTRELFKPSKDSASLVVSNKKYFFWFWVSAFL